jgi:hypothetical protein
VHTRYGEYFIAIYQNKDDSTSEPITAKTINSTDEKEFWNLINLLDWQAEGNDSAVIAPLVEKLAKRNTEDIFKFAEILAQKLFLLDGEIYAKEIGADAYASNKGTFAKNLFLYVRCCAVANGHDFYSAVVLDPKRMPKEMEFQALLNVAPQAYKLKTGQRFNYISAHNYETFSNKELWVNK